MNITLNEIAEKAARDEIQKYLACPNRTDTGCFVTRALQEAHPELHRSRESWIKIAEDHGKTIKELRQQLEETETALTYERGARENALLRLQQSEADREIRQQLLQQEQKVAISIAVTCATMGFSGKDGGIVSAVKEMASELAQLRTRATTEAVEKHAKWQETLNKLQQAEDLLRRFTDECQKQGINLGPLVADARALIDQKGKK